MRIAPDSTTFTSLLGLLVALPSFGVDMSLPALSATGVALGAAPAQIGLAMSTFMLGFAAAPLLYGPASDHYGRKPVMIFACALFAIAGIGCGLSRSLPNLLSWRVVQGAGAGASMTMAMAIVRDLFEGQSARTKISQIATTMMMVPAIAPTLGFALLTLGGWRLIHAVLAGIGAVLLVAILLGFTESARIDPASRMTPSTIARNYFRVLKHPVCAGYILANAASFGALIAYVGGSPLFLINAVGLSSAQYGLVFAATSLAIMGGAFVNGRLSDWQVPSRYPLGIGLVLAAVSAGLLLAMALMGWVPLVLVIPLLILGNLAFRLVAPNTLHEAIQPLPQIAGAASAAAGSIQMGAGAVSSGLVAFFYDGHSALSMAFVMCLCSLLALVSYLFVVGPAESAVSIS